jgi:UDP-N-acetylglucosamine:LPS N-acetylglucosamine transferase
MKKKKKVILISSAGGHLFQLLQLHPIYQKYDSLLVTEKLDTTLELKEKYNVKYLLGGTRKNIGSFIFSFTFNIIKSFIILVKFNPNVIISTGVHTAIPMCYLGKLLGKKIIYFETFARVSDKTLAGKLAYPISDLFFVQWEGLLKVYPKAIYKGGLY